MSPILCAITLSLIKEVRAQQSVEVYDDHNVHDHHANEEKLRMVQLGVVVNDVPSEVELCD